MELPRRLARDRRGATLVEYTIMIGLFSAVLIVLVQSVVGWVEEQWSAFDEELCKIPEHAQGRGCEPPGHE